MRLCAPAAKADRNYESWEVGWGPKLAKVFVKIIIGLNYAKRGCISRNKECNMNRSQTGEGQQGAVNNASKFEENNGQGT